MTPVPRPRRPLRRALAASAGVVLGALAGLTLALPVAASMSASPALAAAAPRDCTPGLSTAIRSADDVLVGTVIGTEETGTRRAPETSVRVEVASVHKGDLAEREVTVLVTPSALPRRDLASPREGRDYVFFTRDRGGELHASACGGYAVAQAAVVRRVDRIAPARSPEDPPTPVQLTPPPDGTPGPPAPVVQIMAPGLALAVVGGLGLFVVAVTGRRP